MRRQHQSWILVALFMAMTILLISLAGRQCLWVDEIFSLAIATGHSLEHPAASANPAEGDFVEPGGLVLAAELQKYLAHDNPPASPARVIRAVLISDTSPPLYYLLLYLWTIVAGTSDLALRYFSVLWYLAAFPLFVGVARRTGDESSVLPASILFALSPLGLYFAGEGRMYSLLLFCVLAVAWASLVLSMEGGGLALYVLWIAASAAGFLTHYFFALPWVGIVIFLFLRPGKFRRSRLLICLCLVAVAIFPWYAAALTYSDRWRLTQGWLMTRPTGYNGSRAMRNQILQFFSPGGSGLWSYERWPVLLALAAFFLVAGTLAWRLRGRAFAGNRLLVWLWFLLAAVTPSLIDLMRRTYFANNPRYTIAALPAAYILAGMGLACLSRRIAVLVVVLVLVSWGTAILKVYRLESRVGERFRLAAQVFALDPTPSDAIIVHSIPSGVLGVARYCSKTTPIAAWVQQLGQRTVPQSIASLVRGKSRIFFVLVHPLGEPVQEEQWLRQRSIVSQDGWTERTKIVEFRPKSGETF
jgi:uncharacterized membrane protein